MREQWKNTSIDEMLLTDFITRGVRKIRYVNGIYFIPIPEHSEIPESLPIVRQFGIFDDKEKYGIALLQVGLVLFWSATSETVRMVD